MKQWKKQLFVTLAVGLAVWTVFVTWAATRLSSFIIYNDDVWERMEGRGYGLELMLAQDIHIFRCLGLLPIVTGGILLLGLLVWLTTRRHRNCTPGDAEKD